VENAIWISSEYKSPDDGIQFPIDAGYYPIDLTAKSTSNEI